MTNSNTPKWQQKIDKFGDMDRPLSGKELVNLPSSLQALNALYYKITDITSIVSRAQDNYEFAESLTTPEFEVVYGLGEPGPKLMSDDEIEKTYDGVLDLITYADLAYHFWKDKVQMLLWIASDNNEYYSRVSYLRQADPEEIEMLIVKAFKSKNINLSAALCRVLLRMDDADKEGFSFSEQDLAEVIDDEYNEAEEVFDKLVLQRTLVEDFYTEKYPNIKNDVEKKDD